MDVFEAMKRRRSVAQFRRTAVPREAIYKMLDAARHAPSAGNLQSWEFVIVEQPAFKQQLAAACLNQAFVADAPIVIVVCSDTERSAVKYGARGKSLYSICDAAAATENLLLAATAAGLGTCWVGAFDEEKVRKALGLPSTVLPLAVVPVGYAVAEPPAPSRVPLSNVVHFEQFGKFDVHRTAEAEPQEKVGRRKSLLDIFK